MSKIQDDIRRKIANLIEEFALLSPSPSGSLSVPVTGKVYDATEMRYAVDAVLDGWWTTGRFAADFERAFAKYMGVRSISLTNSGSSANLLAISALTSKSLGDRRLLPGDEVITVAAGFPTTVAPIVQNGLVPVFVDVKFPTYNVDESLLEGALSGRTRAVMVAHTLGNTFNVNAVTEFARTHDLFLIEDTCDAVGSTYDGKRVGAFGDLATVSFYPAHHITMGEGGAVMSDSPALKKIVESFRDWGRDCWCEPGYDNTCGIRFDQQFGELPEGYDHKYVYSHLGYNLKISDMQAAIGLAQLEKINGFVETRRKNFSMLSAALGDLKDRVILPEAEPLSDPSWFGFPITLRDRKSEMDRRTVISRLEAGRIGTRLLFGGNLIKQPAFRDVKFRVASDLQTTEAIMERTFWVGVYPGITPAKMEYLIEQIRAALS
jgi:CDP-6-deoxy-D-xylo-4-hexulose-3-dehydrase